MNNQNSHETQVNINFVLMEYQTAVSELNKENLMLKAYVKQLQKEIEELSTQKVKEDSK
jgi:predicted RNase H-like nuclease (RuvC/YqgF family)